MFGLAEKIKQGRHEIDVTNWMRNSFGACLTRKLDQEGNASRFFEHCFFPEEMMRPQAVTMIASVHNNRVIS